MSAHAIVRRITGGAPALEADEAACAEKADPRPRHPASDLVVGRERRGGHVVVQVAIDALFGQHAVDRVAVEPFGVADHDVRPDAFSACAAETTPSTAASVVAFCRSPMLPPRSVTSGRRRATWPSAQRYQSRHALLPRAPLARRAAEPQQRNYRPVVAPRQSRGRWAATSARASRHENDQLRARPVSDAADLARAHRAPVVDDAPLRRVVDRRQPLQVSKPGGEAGGNRRAATRGLDGGDDGWQGALRRGCGLQAAEAERAVGRPPEPSKRSCARSIPARETVAVPSNAAVETATTRAVICRVRTLPPDRILDERVRDARQEERPGHEAELDRRPAARGLRRRRRGSARASATSRKRTSGRRR